MTAAFHLSSVETEVYVRVTEQSRGRNRYRNRDRKGTGRVLELDCSMFPADLQGVS